MTELLWSQADWDIGRKGVQMRRLSERVAVVTGASRGVGKGIAIALGEQGATVYVTGRTGGGGERSVEATAEAVGAAGGEGSMGINVSLSD